MLILLIEPGEAGTLFLLSLFRDMRMVSRGPLSLWLNLKYGDELVAHMPKVFTCM